MCISERVRMWKESKSLEGFEVAEEMSNGPEELHKPRFSCLFVTLIKESIKGEITSITNVQTLFFR